MLTKDNLRQFTGSESFAKYMMGYVLSEGALHVAQEGEAFWLMDAIISHQITPKVAQHDLQVWKLTVNGRNQVPDLVHDVSPASATLTCEDGDGILIAKQEIDYTDFPLDNVTLWVQNKTLFLPSEY